MRGKPKNVLSDRHRQLVHYYFTVSKFNKTDALRRAGYSIPEKQHNIFMLPSVKAEIKRRQEKVRERYEVSYDRVVEELAKIAFSSILDYSKVQEDGSLVFNFSDVSPEEMAALGEVTVEEYTEGRGEEARKVKRVRVKPWSKLTALENLMRHAGLSKEKTPFEGAADLVDRILAGRRRASVEQEEGEDDGE